MSQARIREWYEHWQGDVCVSFSGGKDSTVLAHLVHEYYPDVPLVFVNTGLEYPEIQNFAKKMGAEFVRPKMRFDEVISTYGYPIISKENAESIYYARKIRNGGGYTTERKRIELCGKRTTGVNALPNLKGGVHGDAQTERRPARTESLYQGRTGWRRAALTGKPLSVGGVQSHRRSGSGCSSTDSTEGFEPG